MLIQLTDELYVNPRTVEKVQLINNLGGKVVEVDGVVVFRTGNSKEATVKFHQLADEINEFYDGNY